jgi:hypothetical protein
MTVRRRHCDADAVVGRSRRDEPEFIGAVERTAQGHAYAPGVSLVVDPLGRTVHLSDERWEHIVDGHPYMRPIAPTSCTRSGARRSTQQNRGRAKTGSI